MGVTPVTPHTKGIDKDPTIRELNRNAEQLVFNQAAYYVQMAHKHRSPRADVPWFRIVGCEQRSTLEEIFKREKDPWKSDRTWGAYLAKQVTGYEAKLFPVSTCPSLLRIVFG